MYREGVSTPSLYASEILCIVQGHNVRLLHKKEHAMITPAMPRNIQFRTETMFVGNKNKVGRIRPDENGIYKGLPMMVLGQVTQQQTYYDPKSVMDQITSPESRFGMIMRQGKVYGEWGHPTFYGMSDNDKLQRLVTVDESKISHVFTSLYTDPASADGTVVLRGDVKPTGPYGDTFKNSLDDPVVNTAFSLRAYVDTKMRPDGLKYRTVRSLTTWDTVGPSGYATTDKANALGLESFGGDQFHDYEINVMENGNLLIDQIALESFTNTHLNEIFGTADVARIVHSRTLVKVDPSLSQRFPNLYPTSVFNEFFKDI